MCLVSAIVPFASLASAQDAQSADGGAPITTTTATTSATTPPTTTIAPPPPAVTTQTTTQSSPSEQEPLRLGRFVELEADRARAKRYGGSAVEMVVGAGGILSGALVFTIDTTGVDSSLVTVLDILGVASIIAGGLALVDGIISLVVPSPMERLFDRYAPVAIDKSLSPSDRLRRGELMLEAMANAERTQRITGAASSIVLAVLEAGLAIFVAADNDIWANDGNADADRAIFTAAFALGAVTSLGDGIGKIVWERGAAEIAWEHWHSMHETVVVQTSKVKFTPTVGPIRGGAVAGFSLRF
ncbi:MAG TPA: hypothetical protein VGH87_11890 [Polyangiaceae bacterium]